MGKSEHHQSQSEISHTAEIQYLHSKVSFIVICELFTCARLLEINQFYRLSRLLERGGCSNLDGRIRIHYGVGTMGISAKSLGIDKLNVEERLELIGEIWDSVSEEAGDLCLSSELKEELDRRLAAADANPEAAVPWEDVKRKAIERLSK